MFFRKKPVVVRAVQLVPGNDENILAFMRETNCPFEVTGDHEVVVHTLEGYMVAKKGSWLIQGVKGEFYPCDPEVFAETYEEVAQ